jgi:hypothetical protein
MLCHDGFLNWIFANQQTALIGVFGDATPGVLRTLFEASTRGI